jgi:hypothetical protein
MHNLQLDIRQFERLVELVEINNNFQRLSQVSDKVFYEKLNNLLPKNLYGVVAGTQPRKDWFSEFSRNLQEGSVDSFLQSSLVEDVYIVRADMQSQVTMKEEQQHIWQNHSLENMQKIKTKIVDFMRTILQQDSFLKLPVVVQKAYRHSTESELRFVETLRQIGQRGFTETQRTPAEWGNFVGNQNEEHLPYYAQALAVLQGDEFDEFAPKNVGEALAPFHFTQEQLAIIPDLDEGEKSLTAEQGKVLFELLLWRLGLTDLGQDSWQVIWTDNNTISVNAKARVWKIPRTRVLTAPELRFVIVHELTHVLRAYNGSLQQGCLLVQTGLCGYIETEEGLAILAEMITGLSYSGARLRKQAARYLAIDMGLQVTSKNGKKIPRYSLQDIYIVMRHKYGVSKVDALDIIWRMLRGTTLKRELVEIQCKDSNGNTWQRTIPEINVKDGVYFLEIEKLFDWFRRVIPYHSDLTPILMREKDFSSTYFEVVSQIVEIYSKAYPKLTNRMKFVKEVNVGEQVVMRIFTFFLQGKLSFEDIISGNWADILHPAEKPFEALFL